jgi:hypothetical protein
MIFSDISHFFFGGRRIPMSWERLPEPLEAGRRPRVKFAQKINDETTPSERAPRGVLIQKEAISLSLAITTVIRSWLAESGGRWPGNASTNSRVAHSLPISSAM